MPIPAPQRLSPAWRGTIKVGLCVLLATILFRLGDALLWLLGSAGIVPDDVSAPWIAYEYAVAAIALSYQSMAPQMKASFRRRFVGTVGGMLIGAAAWYLPGGTVMAVVPAVLVGWGFGIWIDGMGTADKSAFLAGLTALYPTDHPLFSLFARSAGLLIGFIVVLVVVTQVWPADAPEERADAGRWPWHRRTRDGA